MGTFFGFKKTTTSHSESGGRGKRGKKNLVTNTPFVPQGVPHIAIDLLSHSLLWCSLPVGCAPGTSR